MTMPEDGNAQGEDAQDLNWLLANFAAKTVGVTEAIAVSSDGFLLAASAGVEAPGMEQLGAIISGMTSLTQGASDLYGYSEVRQIIVEMGGGYLFVMSVDDGSVVGVLADARAEVGLVGYEMALLIDRVGQILTPGLVDDLKNAISMRSLPS